MNKTITIDKELLYEVLGTLRDYLLLIEEGIIRWTHLSRQEKEQF